MIEEISSTLPNMPKSQSQSTSFVQNESGFAKKMISVKDSMDYSGLLLGPKESVAHHAAQTASRHENKSKAEQESTSKKVKLSKLVSKLNKSLEDFFLNDAPEDSSYVEDTSIVKHYCK